MFQPIKRPARRSWLPERPEKHKLGRVLFSCFLSNFVEFRQPVAEKKSQMLTSKFRELWSPARQQIWPWSRSKVTVKVTTWYHRKGLVTKNTHAKYQSSTCNSEKVMAKVKVFVTDRQRDGRTDRQTDEWDLMSPRFRESGGQQLMTSGRRMDDGQLSTRDYKSVLSLNLKCHFRHFLNLIFIYMHLLLRKMSCLISFVWALPTCELL